MEEKQQKYKSNIMRWLHILPAAIIPYDNFDGDRKLKHLLREQLTSNIYDKKYRITYCCIESLRLLFFILKPKTIPIPTPIPPTLSQALPQEFTASLSSSSVVKVKTTKKLFTQQLPL